MFERISLAMAGRVQQRDKLWGGAKRLDCAKGSRLHIECWWQHHALAMWCFFAHPGKQMQIQKEAPWIWNTLKQGANIALLETFSPCPFKTWATCVHGAIPVQSLPCLQQGTQLHGVFHNSSHLIQPVWDCHWGKLMSNYTYSLALLSTYALLASARHHMFCNGA